MYYWKWYTPLLVSYPPYMYMYFSIVQYLQPLYLENFQINHYMR